MFERYKTDVQPEQNQSPLEQCCADKRIVQAARQVVRETDSTPMGPNSSLQDSLKALQTLLSAQGIEVADGEKVSRWAH